MTTERKEVNISNITNVKEFRKAANLPRIENDKPIELLKRKGDQYPVNALGERLSEIVKEIHRIVQAPLGICAQSVLFALSYAAQSLANIHIDSQVIPLSLYFFTVAQSGERKSATDNIASKPIAQHEEGLQDDFLIACKNFEESKDCHINMEKPLDPTILMQEPTFEGLVKAFETGQPSLALFSDEGGHFLSGHAMSADNRIKTVTGLSSLWDGAPISRVRAGQPNIKLYNKRLAFHLMMQPGIALTLFGDRALVDQGFMSRCLLSYPESTMGSRQYIAEDIYDSEPYTDYKGRMFDLFHAQRPTFGRMTLSAEAVQLYLQFYYRIETELEQGGSLRDIAGFANKMLNQACRLAAVMTLYDDTQQMIISAPTFQNAIHLVEYYLSENIRLIGESVIKLIPLADEEKLICAQTFWDWLKRSDVRQKHSQDGLIKFRQLMLYSPRAFRNKETLLTLMAILVEYGYVAVAGNARNIWSYISDEASL